MKTRVVEFIGRIQDGGAETLVKDYALLLNKELFEVVVLCEDYKKESSVYKTLRSNNIKIVSMYEPTFFIYKVLARLLGKKYIAKLFKKEIEKIKPDVIHSHLEVLEILYYAKESLNGIKLLFTCHNPPEMLIGNGRPKERDACRYLLDNINLQIIALHKDMATEIEKMFNINDVAVIRNGIDFNRFRKIPETKEEIRQKLGIPEDAYVIGQIGRFAYQKNPEFTIKVFNELLKKKGNSYLLLIGRGKQEKELRKYVLDLGISDKVLFLIERSDVPQLLKAMDVFVFPSRFEGFGIVLIEAQTVGVYCVTSDNIPVQAYQSKNITRLSLNDPIEMWTEAILTRKPNIEDYGNLDDYDMNKEIKHLEKLYLK